MGLTLKDTGGTLRPITSLSILDGTTPRTLRTLKVMGTDNVTLRTVATFGSPLTVATPVASYSGYDTSNIVNIGPVGATPTGGTAPYTYAWAVISGACTIVSPASASTAFQSPSLAPGSFALATVRCTCTDAGGQVATCDVDLTFEFVSPYY